MSFWGDFPRSRQGLDTPVAASQAQPRGSLDHHQRIR
jgi:hypothetical protein